MPYCLTEHSALRSTESSEAWSEVKFSSRKKHSVPKPWREAAKYIIHLSRWIKSCHLNFHFVYCTWIGVLHICIYLCTFLQFMPFMPCAQRLDSASDLLHRVQVTGQTQVPVPLSVKQNQYANTNIPWHSRGHTKCGVDWRWWTSSKVTQGWKLQGGSTS